MKAKTLTSAVLGLAVMTGGYQAHAETSFGFGGDIEVDTNYLSNNAGGSDDDSNMGGRVKLTASGMHESDRGYISGVGQVVLAKDGNASVDDMYVRFGSDNFGIQIGRFEATDLFSEGTDAAHSIIGSTNYYHASAARGRTSDTGQIMFDTTAGNVKFELATIWGESAGATDEKSIAGVRPAVVWDATDDLRVTLGYESVDNSGSEITGFGLYVRYATDAFALKLNYASGEQESNGTIDWENTSYNINLESGNFGIGYTSTEDEGGDSATALYGRYLIPSFMGVDNASASINIGVSGADSLANDQTLVKFRINYTF